VRVATDWPGRHSTWHAKKDFYWESEGLSRIPFMVYRDSEQQQQQKELERFSYQKN
jgi:hypothetical protein